MIEGVRLYQHIRKELDKAGIIKRAWFTTFNLNVSFFEQWILPAITRMDFAPAKTLRDFEDMNDALAGTDEILGIEVRIFYDFRALEKGSDLKRTSIQLHPVDMNSFQISGNRNYFKGGVFHPKVALFQNDKDDFYLLVSSANITQGGWARNRECFFFSKVEGKNNARQIGNFFDAITQPFDFHKDNDALFSLTKGKGWGDDPSWAFKSSLTHFFDEDLKGCIEMSREKHLTIWSPYWSMDLQKLLIQFKELGLKHIRLLPARSFKSRKIPIPTQTYNACKEEFDWVSFEEERWLRDEMPFVHAKIWMLDNTLCIGSWNMTRSGCNIQNSKKRSEDFGNNLEAGVFNSLSQSEYHDILSVSGFKKIGTVGHLTEDEIEEEKAGILEPFDYPFEITADWKAGMFQLTYPDIKKIPSEYLKAVVNLPGDMKVPIVNFEKPVRFLTYGSSLRNNRYFSVILGDKTIFQGYINEINVEDRPSNEFLSETELLMAWIDGQPEERTDLIVKRIDEEDNENVIAEKTPEANFFSIKPWFSNLHGFARIRANLREAASLRRVEDRKQGLIRTGRIRVGSLAELSSKLSRRKEQYLALPEPEKVSPIFLWFMIEEANHCIKVYNKLLSDDSLFEERMNPIDNLDITEYLSSKHQVVYKLNQIREYLELAKSTIQRGV